MIHRLFRFIVVIITSIALLMTYSSGKSRTTNLRKAFCAVPVADLVGAAQKTTAAYANIPVCGGLNPGLSCNRIHQLLYNEIVDIIDENDYEYSVSIPSVYYVPRHNTSAPQTNYWVAKNALVTFESLKKHGLPTTMLPHPINFNQSDSVRDQSIVTLAMPHYDASLNITFSAGTRFVHTHDQDTALGYTAFAFDKRSFTVTTIMLPRNICIIDTPSTSPATRIKNFVALLKTWAHLDNGFIPYVLGGSSFTHTYSTPFFEHTNTNNGTPTSYFVFEGAKTDETKTGFDCSNLIARAAQMTGIPYFFKNTFTIEHNMPPLKKTEALSIGDTILIRGHVMIVSDIEQNLLIEARGYEHGYGKIQELPLNKVFADINTYQDLVQAYRNGTTLYRIDNKGTVRDTIPQIKLFKMAGIFNKNV